MNETKFLIRWWWAWNFDKEEAWLNRMAEEGWALKKAFFIFFTFEKTQPGEYIIRMENRGRDSGYQEFLEELGAERVGKCVGWHYYRRKSELGPFDLLSDLKSRITHLKRIERIFLPILLMNISIGVMNSLNSSHAGYINLLCAVLIAFGCGCVKTKRELLEKEADLQE